MLLDNGRLNNIIFSVMKDYSYFVIFGLFLLPVLSYVQY